MKFAYLTLLMALLMAGCAMYFSVVGMMAIFAGAATSAMIMMIILESAKLVGAAWLHRNWQTAPWALKSYMTFAVIVLMFITSLGIFGGLSKAHIEQNAPIGNTQAQIERLDQRIAIEQRRIDDAELVQAQLDDAVDTLIEYDRIRGPSGSIAVRQSQSQEREQLSDEITAAQNQIDIYKDERFILASQIREFEVKVGPIKYVADIIYDNSSKESLEQAVQWLIIVIIFVFDPFAILLVIAANRSLSESDSHQSINKDDDNETKSSNEETAPSFFDGMEEFKGSSEPIDLAEIDRVKPQFRYQGVSTSTKDKIARMKAVIEGKPPEQSELANSNESTIGISGWRQNKGES